MAPISRPSQVTGWPIRANSHDGQPSRASTAIATAIAPAKPTPTSCPAPVAQSEGGAQAPGRLISALSLAAIGD
ncbi:hypothetical protein ACVWZR_010477 [Bradyrhizobium sp. i1.3.1]